MHATPVQAIGLGNVTAISAGDAHNLALKSDGTMRAWGQNDHGQVGDGSTANRAARCRRAG